MVRFTVKMKILQLKMKILPLKTDDFGATRGQMAGPSGNFILKMMNFILNPTELYANDDEFRTEKVRFMGIHRVGRSVATTPRYKTSSWRRWGRTSFRRQRWTVYTAWVDGTITPSAGWFTTLMLPTPTCVTAQEDCE